MTIHKTLRADFYLILVAIIWGATFPLTVSSLQYISPFLFVAVRFVLATLLFSIWILPTLKKTNMRILKAGFILGIFNALVYLLQTYGMRYIDADTSAFVASAGVIFVPFLAPFFGLSKVKPIEILGSLICLAGLFILTHTHMRQFSMGELLILGSAFIWAASVCYLQAVSPRIDEPGLLAFYQILFAVPFALAVSKIGYTPPIFKPIVILSLFYLALFATIVVFMLQARYQRDTTATHAAIIYSLEPVLATIMAYFMNHEGLTRQVVIGGGLIILSILMVEILPRVWRRLK